MTTLMIDDERMGAIAARINEATDAPLKAEEHDYPPAWEGMADNVVRAIVRADDEDQEVVSQLGCGCCDIGLIISKGDLDLFLNARADLAYLWNMVTRLQAEVR